MLGLVGQGIEHENKYPIPPGDNITKVSIIELIFELISNSLKDLEDCYRENTRIKRVHLHMPQNK